VDETHLSDFVPKWEGERPAGASNVRTPAEERDLVVEIARMWRSLRHSAAEAVALRSGLPGLAEALDALALREGRGDGR
jgi:hypothetical protein